MGGGGGPDIVQTVIRIFLEETPGLLDSLGRSLEARDYSGAARLAHKLKSSSANLGARRLISFLDRFETLSAAEPQGAWDALFASIRLETQRILAELIRAQA